MTTRDSLSPKESACGSGAGGLFMQAAQACGKPLTSSVEKPRWVEGIADELKDNVWASEAHVAIEGEFTCAGKARFDVSRMNRVANEFYPYRKHAA